MGEQYDILVVIKSEWLDCLSSQYIYHFIMIGNLIVMATWFFCKEKKFLAQEKHINS